MPQRRYSNSRLGSLTAKQVPKRVLWRQRWQLVKSVLFFALIVLLGYQVIVTNSSQARQLASTQEKLSGLQEELKLMRNPGLAAVGEELDLEEQLFALIGTVGKLEKDEQALVELRAALSDLEDKDWPGGYIYRNGVLVADDFTLLNFYLNEPELLISVEIPTGVQEFTEVKKFQNFVDNIREVDLTNWERQSILMSKLGQDLLSVLETEDITPLTWQSLSSQRAIVITNSEQQEVARITWYVTATNEGVYKFNDTEIDDENLNTKLPALIKNLDGRSQIEKLFASHQAELEKIIEGKTFQAALSEQKLILGNSRSDNSAIFYPIISEITGNQIELILEKGTGLIKVLENGQPTTIRAFIDSQGKKKTLNLDELPTDLTYLEPVTEDQVILLAGKHGSLTDTIMLAIVDDTKRTVDLVSIPRDLWWQGKKINSYYLYGDMPDLVEQIEAITNYQIDHYALIDMYAFIDVVDVLGGIDITLAEAVIDPSYKTFDNGRWGTLHYEPGSYHLNGTQALRLARSRHYSSDFARAERQQEILKALQVKGQELSFLQVGKLTTLADAVFSRLDTDISLRQGIAYFYQYKDYDMKNTAVLNSSNILQARYSNQASFEQCLADGEEEAACSKGAYILVPENNNWDLIHWYIEQQRQV